MTPLEINKKIGKIRYDHACSVEINGTIIDNSVVCHNDSWISIMRLGECKNWAESISDAWELFEEMVKTEYAFLVREKQHRHGDLWIVQIVLDYENRIANEYFAPTAPMAICLAYIKWKTAEASQTHNPQSHKTLKKMASRKSEIEE